MNSNSYIQNTASTPTLKIYAICLFYISFLSNLVKPFSILKNIGQSATIFLVNYYIENKVYKKLSLVREYFNEHVHFRNHTKAGIRLSNFWTKPLVGFDYSVLIKNKLSRHHPKNYAQKVVFNQLILIKSCQTV